MNEQIINKIKEFVYKYASYFKINNNSVAYGIQFDLCDHALYGCPGGAYVKGGYDYRFKVRNDTSLLEYISIQQNNEIVFVLKALHETYHGYFSEGIDCLLENDYKILYERLQLMLENKHVTEYTYKQTIYCKGVAQLRLCCYELYNRGFIKYKIPNFYLKGNLWVNINRNGFMITYHNTSDNAIPFSKNCLDKFMVNEKAYIPTHEYTKLKK